MAKEPASASPTAYCDAPVVRYGERVPHFAQRLLRISSLLLIIGHSLAAERINHEGRILGPQLVVTNATLFNTPESDAILDSLPIVPLEKAAFFRVRSP